MPVPSSSATKSAPTTTPATPSVTSSSGNGRLYRRPTSRLPGKVAVTLAPSPNTASTRAAITIVSFTSAYVASGRTAAPTLLGSVHGVVVQTSRDPAPSGGSTSPGSSGNRT